MLFPSFFNAGPATYEIEQSLRFDGSSYLSWTPSSAGNRRTWTWSGWVKRGPVDTTEEDIFGVEYTTGDVPSNSVRFSGSANSDQKPRFSVYLGSGGDFSARSSGVARDPAAWMHFVAVWDTTNATESERMRFYINGEQQSRYYGNSITQNTEGSFNTTSTHRFSGGSTYGRLFKGYLAETHFVDGTALDATDFGEFDNNGVWRPIRYTGSYGTNGFYLKFDPSATNGIGHDHSGNGNNFTASGFTTSGTGTDVMSDTPTNNFATINPIDKQNGTLSNGNLDLTATGSNYSTIGATSGKYYLEYTVGTSGGSSYNFHFGFETLGSVSQKTMSMGMCNGGNSPNIFNILHNTNGTATAPTGSRPSLPATIGCKLNLDDGEVEFLVNGSVNGKITGITNLGSDPIGFFASHYTGTFSDFPCTVNFGQRAFANTIPTGYSPLSTSNLPAPTVKDGSEYFGTLLYTADNSAGKTVTGLNFGAAPDFVWIKNRDNVESHHLMDVVRGNDSFLMSNRNDAERDRPYADTNDTTDFDFETNGFSFVSTNYNQGELYFNNRTYVGFNWLAGGSVSADNNTDGSITSTVSANPSAGFSIVSYTADGNNNTSVGHGLGVAPKIVIQKDRDSASSWLVSYNFVDGSNDYLLLDSTQASNSGLVSLTSTTFGSWDRTSGNKMIAYCFAEVEGYSKFGSYTGNGSTDGPFVYCGFRPAFVMTKNTVGTQDWQIRDDQRLGYNPTDRTLAPNDSRAENGAASSYEIDFLSNGFKIKGGLAAINGSGNSIVFAAFASNPFGGSGVSPATAR